MVCQEMGLLALLILSVSKEYLFPWKHKKMNILQKMELCPTKGQKTHFSSAFCPLLSLWKDHELETFPFCIAISWSGCWWPALSAPGPISPLIQDPRKPLAGPCIHNPQNGHHDTLWWWNTVLVCRSEGTCCSPENLLHVLLYWGDLWGVSVSPT